MGSRSCFALHFPSCPQHEEEEEEKEVVTFDDPGADGDGMSADIVSSLGDVESEVGKEKGAYVVPTTSSLVVEQASGPSQDACDPQVGCATPVHSTKVVVDGEPPITTGGDGDGAAIVDDSCEPEMSCETPVHSTKVVVEGDGDGVVVQGGEVSSGSGCQTDLDCGYADEDEDEEEVEVVVQHPEEYGAESTEYGGESSEMEYLGEEQDAKEQPDCLVPHLIPAVIDPSLSSSDVGCLVEPVRHDKMVAAGPGNGDGTDGTAMVNAQAGSHGSSADSSSTSSSGGDSSDASSDSSSKSHLLYQPDSFSDKDLPSPPEPEPEPPTSADGSQEPQPTESADSKPAPLEPDPWFDDPDLAQSSSMHPGLVETETAVARCVQSKAAYMAEHEEAARQFFEHGVDPWDTYEQHGKSMGFIWPSSECAGVDEDSSSAGMTLRQYVKQLNLDNPYEGSSSSGSGESQSEPDSESVDAEQAKDAQAPDHRFTGSSVSSPSSPVPAPEHPEEKAEAEHQEAQDQRKEASAPKASVGSSSGPHGDRDSDSSIVDPQADSEAKAVADQDDVPEVEDISRPKTLADGAEDAGEGPIRGSKPADIVVSDKRMHVHRRRHKHRPEQAVRGALPAGEVPEFSFTGADQPVPDSELRGSPMSYTD